MSDALSDIAHDERRFRNSRDFWLTLLKFVGEEATEDNLKEAASIASGGSHGYFSSPVYFEDDIDSVIEGLKSNDKQVWAKILWQSMDYINRWPGDNFGALLELSPFKDHVIVQVWYAHGWSKLKPFPDGYISDSLVDKIVEAHNWVTNDSDKYLIVLNEDNKTGEAFWLRCDALFGIETNGCMVYHRLKKPRVTGDWKDTEDKIREYCLESN